MRFIRPLACLVFLFAVSCAPASSTAPPEVLSAFATPATQPWLSELFDCAAEVNVIINVSSKQPDIFLRIGEPDELTTPAYQIDSEDIMIVTHRDSPLHNLTLELARDLFVGRGDPSVQVWVYASGEDVQEVFDQVVMSGGGVSSFARLAVSPQHMSDALSAEVNAVGILSRKWMTDSMREVFAIHDLPVLAIVQDELSGSVKELLACMQK